MKKLLKKIFKSPNIFHLLSDFHLPIERISEFVFIQSMFISHWIIVNLHADSQQFSAKLWSWQFPTVSWHQPRPSQWHQWMHRWEWSKWSATSPLCQRQFWHFDWAKWLAQSCRAYSWSYWICAMKKQKMQCFTWIHPEACQHSIATSVEVPQRSLSLAQCQNSFDPIPMVWPFHQRVVQDVHWGNVNWTRKSVDFPANNWTCPKGRKVRNQLVLRVYTLHCKIVEFTFLYCGIVEIVGRFWIAKTLDFLFFNV